MKWRIKCLLVSKSNNHTRCAGERGNQSKGVCYASKEFEKSEFHSSFV